MVCIDMLMGESSTHIGQYEVRERIGGARSRIFKVWDPAEDRILALKLLATQAADDLAGDRFRREAALLATIAHPHIVRVNDQGEDRTGEPYFTMEFLQGQTLKEGIKRGNLGPLRARIELALQLAQAVEHLHSLQITQCRLHPEHIFVDRAGRMRMLSVGIAQPRSDARYQPPTTSASALDDLYSYGAVVWDMLGGEHEEAVGRVPLPAVPRPLQDLIRRCTAADPARRPESVAMVIRELERWLAEPEAMVRSYWWQKPVIISRRRLPLVAAAGVVTVLLGSYGAFLGGYRLGQAGDAHHPGIVQRSYR